MKLGHGAVLCHAPWRIQPLMMFERNLRPSSPSTALRGRSRLWPTDHSITAALLLLLVAGCQLQRASGTVQREHGAEFDCAPESVQVKPLTFRSPAGRGTLRAVGCGVRATYSCSEIYMCVRLGAAGSSSGSEVAGHPKRRAKR